MNARLFVLSVLAATSCTQSPEAPPVPATPANPAALPDVSEPGLTLAFDQAEASEVALTVARVFSASMILRPEEGAHCTGRWTGLDEEEAWAALERDCELRCALRVGRRICEMRDLAPRAANETLPDRSIRLDLREVPVAEVWRLVAELSGRELKLPTPRTGPVTVVGEWTLHELLAATAAAFDAELQLTPEALSVKVPASGRDAPAAEAACPGGIPKSLPVFGYHTTRVGERRFVAQAPELSAFLARVEPRVLGLRSRDWSGLGYTVESVDLKGLSLRGPKGRAVRIKAPGESPASSWPTSPDDCVLARLSHAGVSLVMERTDDRLEVHFEAARAGEVEATLSAIAAEGLIERISSESEREGGTMALIRWVGAP